MTRMRSVAMDGPHLTSGKSGSYMEANSCYECAMKATLVICAIFDDVSGKPRHELLASTIFSILDAINRYEEEKGAWRDAISVN